MQLGLYIRSRRKNLGMTQKQLAKNVGVTDVTISRYENGEREPSFTEFIKLCKVVRVNDKIEIRAKQKGRKENEIMAKKTTGYVLKYKTKTYKRFVVEFRKEDDKEIIDFIYGKGNTNKYFKELVLVDMQKEKGTENQESSTVISSQASIFNDRRRIIKKIGMSKEEYSYFKKFGVIKKD